MPTALDLRLRPRVEQLIAKYGRDATFHVSTKTYDSSTSGVSHASTATHTVKVTPPAPYRRTEPSVEGIRAGDMQIHWAAYGLSWTPEIAKGGTSTITKVTVDGLDFQVISLDRTYSGEQIALYTAQLRR